MEKIPLCVDLDGTLVQTDIFFESLLLLLKKNPWAIFLLPFWLLRGLAFCKAKIANAVDLNVSTLPYCQPLLKWLKHEHQNGRQLILSTGSHHTIAHKISNFIGLFSDVFATSENINLTGKNKCQKHNDTFGAKNYDYVGNSLSDLKVWADCRKALIVTSSTKLIQKAKNISNVDKIFDMPRTSLKSILKAMRIHQYAKNILIFIPLFTGHFYNQISVLEKFIAAFIAFCFIASSVYVLNDLLDLEADRLHATKRHRPFASGILALRIGIFLTIALLISAISISLFLPPLFLTAIIVYYALTMAYSFYFKQRILQDVFALSVLYTMRIIAGMTLLDSGYSAWLLAFSIFFFLSLAFAKRYSELFRANQNNQPIIAGRGYLTKDLPQIALFGTVSGYMAVLIFALYINSDKVIELYRAPQLLWLICFILLFWITRFWFLNTRGIISEDPVAFALKDTFSLGSAFLIVMIGVLAAMGKHL